MTNAKEMKYTNLLGKSTKMYSSVLGVEKYMIFYNSSGFFNKLEWYLLESLFVLNQWAPWKTSYLLNDHLSRNPNHYLLAVVVLFISLWNLNNARDHIRNISVSHRAIFSGFFLWKRELNYPTLKEYQHMRQLCIKSKYMHQTHATHLCRGNSLQPKIFSFNKLIPN